MLISFLLIKQQYSVRDSLLCSYVHILNKQNQIYEVLWNNLLSSPAAISFIKRNLNHLFLCNFKSTILQYLVHILKYALFVYELLAVVVNDKLGTSSDLRPFPAAWLSCFCLCLLLVQPLVNSSCNPDFFL